MIPCCAIFSTSWALPRPATAAHTAAEEVHDLGEIAVPLQIETEAGVLSFLSTTTVFGTPLDITLSELAIESFFPADTRTAEVLKALPLRPSDRNQPSDLRIPPRSVP